MPHIPIPPTSFQSRGLTQLTGKIVANTNGAVNIAQPNSNIAQQIKDIAIEQAKQTVIELMKQQTELKKTVLTIENIDKIRGAKYSEWLSVGGVKEWDNHYEFTLLDDIMEYNNHTLWVTKDRLDTIDAIIECMKEI
jgi:hypothetical protein